MTREVTEELFLNDVKRHAMTVVRDEGVHRHLRFKQAGSSNMYFDIVTYPHFLVYSGDMGCYVFSRINDMFEFFRGKSEGPLRINESYWAEKLEATDKPDGHRSFSPELLESHVTEWLTEQEADDELRERVKDLVLDYAHDGEVRARDALADFEHDGRRPFQDSWDCNFEEYTFRFTWCCYALAWAIRQYDLSKSPRMETRTLPRGKPCTCDNALGSSCSCRVEAGEKLGELWYCAKQARLNRGPAP